MIFPLRSSAPGRLAVVAAVAALAVGLPAWAAGQYYARDYTPPPGLPNPELPATYEDIYVQGGQIGDARLTRVPHGRPPSGPSTRSLRADEITRTQGNLGLGPSSLLAQHPAFRDIPAHGLYGCNGEISTAPDVRLRYTAGNAPLYVSVVRGSGGDANMLVAASLVIRAPDGRWYCDEAVADGGMVTINPAIVFPSPISGNYEIWIGLTMPNADAPNLPDADLYISDVRAVTG
ncbi:MAG: hypothetical protein GC145_13990 [Caulobacter sp.]|nr:hypothetical protein [Caulobacter sp.]